MAAFVDRVDKKPLPFSSAFTFSQAPGRSEAANKCQKPIQGTCGSSATSVKGGKAVFVPFAGTGTSVMAAALEGFDCLALDMDVSHMQGRLGLFAFEVRQMKERSGLFGNLDAPLVSERHGGQGKILHSVAPYAWMALER
jgi:uroporphyrinogen-III decarboxylase